MTKVDNIKTLYKEINNKKDFFEKTAEHFGKRPNTLKTHWFSDANFWSVPVELEDKVIEFMQNYIKAQNGIN